MEDKAALDYVNTQLANRSWGESGILRYEEPVWQEEKPGPYLLDSINQAVIRKIEERAQQGMETYGQPMTRPDKGLSFWLRSLQEELMDGAVYLERVLQDLEQVSKLLGNLENAVQNGKDEYLPIS
jgi:hypothetical protein